MIRNLLITTISIFAVSYILPGVVIDTFVTALIVAVVMAVLNVTLGCGAVSRTKISYSSNQRFVPGSPTGSTPSRWSR